MSQDLALSSSSPHVEISVEEMVIAAERFSSQNEENYGEITDQQMLRAIQIYEDSSNEEIVHEENENMIQSPLVMIENISRQPQDNYHEALIFSIRTPIRKSIYPDYFLSYYEDEIIAEIRDSNIFSHPVSFLPSLIVTEGFISHRERKTIEIKLCLNRVSSNEGFTISHFRELVFNLSNTHRKKLLQYASRGWSFSCISQIYIICLRCRRHYDFGKSEE